MLLQPTQPRGVIEVSSIPTDNSAGFQQPEFDPFLGDCSGNKTVGLTKLIPGSQVTFTIDGVATLVNGGSSAPVVKGRQAFELGDVPNAGDVIEVTATLSGDSVTAEVTADDPFDSSNLPPVPTFVEATLRHPYACVQKLGVTNILQSALVQIKLQDGDMNDANDIVLDSKTSFNELYGHFFMTMDGLTSSSLQDGDTVYVTQTLCGQESPKTGGLDIFTPAAVPTPTLAEGVGSFGQYIGPRYLGSPGPGEPPSNFDGHTGIILLDEGRVPGADLRMYVDGTPVTDTQVVSVGTNFFYYFDIRYQGATGNESH